MPSNAQESAQPPKASATEKVLSPWLGIGRAIGGALVFSLPMMMTMEMWQIGFYIDPLRLIALIVLTLPLFYGVSNMIGFKSSKTLWDNVIDVFVAYAVALLTAVAALVVFGVITSNTDWGKAYTMVLLQAVPGGLGALLGRSVVGSSNASEECEENYRDELIILITGGVFLSFNLAPTEEMILISYMMTEWHVLALLVFTVFGMHMFVVASDNSRTIELRQWKHHYQLFFRFTAIGYVLAFAVSLFMLWVFGRTDQESFGNTMNSAIVLAFPTGVGAAAARLIL